MKTSVQMFLLAMSVSVGACGGGMKQYEKANVEILSVQRLSSGSTEILYKPILESMYYCPGANLRQDGGREKVTLVRCGIHEKCSVDVIAETGAQGQWKVVIPSGQATIDLVFSDGEISFQK